jgi:hypothetical protein
MGLLNQTAEQYYLGNDGLLDSADENYGDYQFISLQDIINNFIIAYVGEDKIISKIKRTDVAFHAQRAIQELSFDTLPSTKTQELELGPSLSIILPQDYVNYVRFSYTDANGIKHIIYPSRDTGNPRAVLQDVNYEPTFDQNGNLLYAWESETSKRFSADNYRTNPSAATADMSVSELYNLYAYGRRYGSSPEHMQSNGVFYIDKFKGIAHFSSNLAGQIITIEYISDGLGTDEEMVVHKFAEEAMYKHIAHAILATRANTPEYLVARFKKEAFASKRNAKLRLSNIKFAEFAQVMRNQSKWIKH